MRRRRPAPFKSIAASQAVSADAAVVDQEQKFIGDAAIDVPLSVGTQKHDIKPLGVITKMLREKPDADI